MIGLRTLARTAALVAVTIAFVGCSDSSSSDGAGSASSDSSATDGSNSVPGSDTTVDGSAVDDTAVDGSAASVTTTSVAGSATTSPPTTVVTTTAPPPATTDPLASAPEPESTEPDDFIGPAAADCVDTSTGNPTVEIGIDDDRILFAGSPATSCLRVHIDQRIAVRNSGSVLAEVLVGSEILTVAPGASASTDVLSTRYEIADVFDVYVETLDATLIVQVIP